ncbi:MAG: hypothetical protein ACYDBB_10050 [Armatimonadota bacterium]
MKRVRQVKLVIGLIVIGLIGCVLAGDSVRQNQVVRKHFSALFKAVQQKDFDTHIEYYTEAAKASGVPVQSPLAPAYLQLLEQSTLVGWEITGISGQPYPLNQLDNEYRMLTANMYYQNLPEQYLQPKGPYKQDFYAKVGMQCVKVPVTLRFIYKEDPHSRVKFWFIVPPVYKTGENWIAPYNGPLETPNPPVRK